MQRYAAGWKDDASTAGIETWVHMIDKQIFTEMGRNIVAGQIQTISWQMQTRHEVKSTECLEMCNKHD